MSGSFIFQGRIYAVRMGEIVRVYNSYLYGDTITLGTERYEVLLTKVSDEQNCSIYEITEITDLSLFNDYPEEENIVDDTSDVLEEEPATESYNQEDFPDLTKLKKDELINLALSWNLDVNSKMTKRDIIELIENNRK